MQRARRRRLNLNKGRITKGDAEARPRTEGVWEKRWAKFGMLKGAQRRRCALYPQRLKPVDKGQKQRSESCEN